MFNGEPLTESSKHMIGDFNADNFGELTVFDLNFFDRGTYQCTITNTHDSQDRDATLNVQGTCNISDTFRYSIDMVMYLH